MPRPLPLPPVVAFLLAAGVVSAAAPPDPDPRALVRAAIQAAGGEEALRAHPALRWRGRATVHLSDRKIALTGYWRLVPPDRAVVETQLAEGGPETMRRLIVDGDQGWGEQGGKAEPLPPAALANERVQFALYSIVRLVPLLGDDYHLAALPAEGGFSALRIAHAGRPDVDAFFAADGRLVRLRTAIIDPDSAHMVDERIELSGTIESNGVRWPRALGMTQDGRPFFNVELTEFEALPSLPETLFRPTK